jgi:hypothetical protein
MCACFSRCPAWPRYNSSEKIKNSRELTQEDLTGNPGTNPRKGPIGSRWAKTAAYFSYRLTGFPITLATSAWYSGVGYGALAMLAIVVLYAFGNSLGGRPLLASHQLDD